MRSGERLQFHDWDQGLGQRVRNVQLARDVLEPLNDFRVERYALFGSESFFSDSGRPGNSTRS